MTTVKIEMKTNLKGLKKWAWRKNLRGFFSFGGRSLTDAEVRKVVEYGIAHGYENPKLLNCKHHD